MRGWVGLTLGVGVLAVALVPRPAETVRPPARPLGFLPIAYYENACARCHGSDGSNYGDTLGANLNDAGLRKVIHEMALGPGGAPIEGAELEAQVAHHRAMIRKVPFLAWTGRRGRLLNGEVSTGATMSLKLPGRVVPVQVVGNRWEVELPPGVPAEFAVLVAVRGERSSRLALVRGPVTDSDPLP